MTPTLTRPRPREIFKAGGNVLLIAGLAAVILLAIVMAPALEPPSVVDQVTVSNPTRFHVEVEVRGLSDQSWLDLGGYGPDSTRTSYEILDQGRSWVFRVSAGGRAGGEMVLTRAELEAAKWRVAIPPEVGEQLAAQGLTTG